MCKHSEAAMLFDLANQFYPDIAPEIARHIAQANEPLPGYELLPE